MGMENILRFDNRSEQSSASVRQKRGLKKELNKEKGREVEAYIFIYIRKGDVE